MRRRTEMRDVTDSSAANRMNQCRMPFVESLEEYASQGFAAFHTPGHKLGTGAPDMLTEWMGSALPYDLGVMYALDDLHEPEGALADAQSLAAELYGADMTRFSINGTTALIQTMILSVVRTGDYIIVPREAHRSVMSGLILSGAMPVYFESRIDSRFGIPTGARPEDIREAFARCPEAKAVLLVYPNYYGVASDIRACVEEAHRLGLAVLIDEAHGAHLPFHPDLPTEAIAAGADLVAQSTHKLVGSLTQTSMLHVKGRLVSHERVHEVFRMLQSTSPNYIFLASLDMARHQMAVEGEALLARTLQLARYTAKMLNGIPGVCVPRCESFDPPIHSLDETKLCIDVRGAGLSGKRFETLLRAEGIEVELVQGHHVLVLITLGDTDASVGRLVEAVRRVVAGHGVLGGGEAEFFEDMCLPRPVVACSPREAYESSTETVRLAEAVGRIAAETISYYPPGIPFLTPGERVTEELLRYTEYKRRGGYKPDGASDPTLETIRVIADV